MKGFGDMMKQAQKVQRQMAEVQEKLAEERFEASAGGGAVKAVVDGKLMLRSLTIAPEQIADGDAALLEDLILTAVGQAQKNAETHMQQTLGKLTGGLGLPF